MVFEFFVLLPLICHQQKVSELLLFNTKRAIFQPYYGENKLIPSQQVFALFP
jgi:hypothetical protein